MIAFLNWDIYPLWLHFLLFQEQRRLLNFFWKYFSFVYFEFFLIHSNIWMMKRWRKSLENFALERIFFRDFVWFFVAKISEQKKTLSRILSWNSFFHVLLELTDFQWRKNMTQNLRKPLKADWFFENFWRFVKG